jgi:hypothetical protein
MRTAIVIMALLLLSCSGKKTEQAGESVPLTEDYLAIFYERTPCFGTCPHFEFKAFASGKCNYIGLRFADREGHFEASASPKNVQGIISLAKQIGFFEMKDFYDDRMVTDLPSTTVELTSEGISKSVLNRYKGPEEIKELYEKLDDLIDSLDWKSIE